MLFKMQIAVTAEEHNIPGGLGHSIAHVAVTNFPGPADMWRPKTRLVKVDNLMIS